MPTTDAVVQAYIQLRDRKKEIATRHKEELAPVNQKMAALETYLLRELLKAKELSKKTPHGTAYRTKRTYAKVEDWDAAFDFIRNNELWHFLEHRVSKEAVQEFIEAQGTPPPGVSVSIEDAVNVRR